MLTKEETTATIQFLDRVQITGHGERQAMNQIVSKLATMAQAEPENNKEGPAQTKPAPTKKAKKPTNA